jgi:hypothetical protein
VPNSTLRLATVGALGFAAAIAALVGAGAAHTTGGCTTVRGHLEVSVDGVSDRMSGSISGEYEFTFDGLVSSANNPDVVYVEGHSVVHTSRGELRFIENSAAAPAFEAGTNNATLMTVAGGTERWDGATGFIALRGFFHDSTQAGEFDYRGEVCRSE